MAAVLPLGADDFAPAVSARFASSEIDSSAVQPGSSPVSTATRNARSLGAARSIMSFVIEVRIADAEGVHRKVAGGAAADRVRPTGSDR
jgi:hypothetical protein